MNLESYTAWCNIFSETASKKLKPSQLSFLHSCKFKRVDQTENSFEVRLPLFGAEVGLSYHLWRWRRLNRNPETSIFRITTLGFVIRDRPTVFALGLKDNPGMSVSRGETFRNAV